MIARMGVLAVEHNKGNNYNVMHSHSLADLIGRDSGELVREMMGSL